MTPQEIIGLFTNIWEKVTIKHLSNLIACFTMIIDTFGEPILRLVNFVIDIVMIVIESILLIMNFPLNLIRKIIAKSIELWHNKKDKPDIYEFA
jgi:hypothetical protein